MFRANGWDFRKSTTEPSVKCVAHKANNNKICTRKPPYRIPLCVWDMSSLSNICVLHCRQEHPVRNSWIQHADRAYHQGHAFRGT